MLATLPTLRCASVVLCLGAALSCLLCFALDTELSSLHPASATALRLAPALGHAAAHAHLYALSALLLFFSLYGLLGRAVALLCTLPLALAAACNLAAASQAALPLASLHTALPDAATVAC